MAFIFRAGRSFGTVGAGIRAKICIVGSGPAGFYAAQYLAKNVPNSEVDLYERFPVPYGLVRYGVAPDHADLKKVINTFQRTIQNFPSIRFLGNVNLGIDVSLRQLRDAYHIVLLTYGADSNRSVGISGEDLGNVIPARKIVGWYNGLPQDADLKLHLESTQCVTIIGQGNVAIDVARIFLKPVDKLKNTDITQHALDVLLKSKVKEVRMVGRRGPLQAAFTIKEFREMLKLEGCSTVWRRKDFEGIADHVPNLERPRKRLTELMLESVQALSGKEAPPQNGSSTGRVFKPIFFRSPLEFSSNSVTLGVNRLEGEDPLHQRAVLVDGATETLDTDVVVTCVGYKSVQADQELPFDFDRGIARNTKGKIEEGLYAAGWLSSGPSGVLLRTMNNAFGCAGTIVKDIEADKLVGSQKPGYEEIGKVLERKNVQVVTWSDWLKIDDYEMKEGQKVNKPREKIVSIRKMLNVASS